MSAFGDSTRLPEIIVAGLGRCGSSMTMQMLWATGIPCAGSHPDFEDERASPLHFDGEWFSNLSGRAVKLLDAQLLPAKLRIPTTAVIVWLDRDPSEQSRSMAKMLSAFSGIEIGRRARKAIEASIRRDTCLARSRLLGSNPLAAIRLSFEDIVLRPYAEAERLAELLRNCGHSAVSARMAGAIRNRPPTCLHGFLETSLIHGGS